MPSLNQLGPTLALVPGVKLFVRVPTTLPSITAPLHHASHHKRAFPSDYALLSSRSVIPPT